MSLQSKAPAGSKGRVLIVDDDDGVRQFLRDALTSEGFHVVTAPDGATASGMVQRGAFDVILSDLAMPGLDGISFLRAVRERDMDVPVLLITGSPSLETAIRAVEYGAFRYLLKPVRLPELLQNVERAAQLARIGKAKREAFELLGKPDRLGGDRAALEAAFNRALSSLWVAFQPIVRWSERRVYGQEGLVRNEEPSLVSPADLLDAAERLERIHDLGRTIRERIATVAPGLDGDCKIFVNLHPLDLNDDVLFDATTAFSRIASRVVLEVTERASLDHVANVRAKVESLKEMGFKIAVDDLGAGYAGLTSFTLLEPHVVKLDMSMIRDLHNHSTKQRLVRSIAEVCRSLGIEVVCEGIEVAEERDALVGMGCDLLQGYLFARPGRPFPVPQY